MTSYNFKDDIDKIVDSLDLSTKLVDDETLKSMKGSGVRFTPTRLTNKHFTASISPIGAQYLDALQNRFGHRIVSHTLDVCIRFTFLKLQAAQKAERAKQEQKAKQALTSRQKVVQSSA